MLNLAPIRFSGMPVGVYDSTGNSAALVVREDREEYVVGRAMILKGHRYIIKAKYVMTDGHVTLAIVQDKTTRRARRIAAAKKGRL